MIMDPVNKKGIKTKKKKKQSRCDWKDRITKVEWMYDCKKFHECEVEL